MKNNIKPIVEEICENLALSGHAYKEYLNNGHTFFYAKRLMKYNRRIQSLITEKSDFLPEDLQRDTAALLFHYQAWTEKWLTLEKQLSPNDNDRFVFENPHTFPRQAAINMEKMLEILRKEDC